MAADLPGNAIQAPDDGSAQTSVGANYLDLVDTQRVAAQIQSLGCRTAGYRIPHARQQRVPPGMTSNTLAVSGQSKGHSWKSTVSLRCCPSTTRPYGVEGVCRVFGFPTAGDRYKLWPSNAVQHLFSVQTQVFYQTASWEAQPCSFGFASVLQIQADLRGSHQPVRFRARRSPAAYHRSGCLP